MQEKGLEGLMDQRSKGNYLKFDEEMKNFVTGLLNQNPSLTSKEVQELIKTYV